jgi:putative ABC transport system permease protein
LKEGGRVSSFGPRNRLRGALVVSEVALALMLLVGAGLLMHSFFRLLKVPTGFNPHDAIAMDVSLSEKKYPDGQRRGQALHQVFQSIAALPGVVAVGTATTLALSGESLGSGVAPAGRENQKESNVNSMYDFIAGNYFQAMGIPILKGRALSERDNSTNAPRVAILNQALAKKVFPKEEAVGRRVRFWGELWEVVGVAGDVRHDGLTENAAERIYLSQVFCPWVGTLVVRTQTNPSSLIDPIRKAILAVDSEQPVSNIRTLEQAVARSVAGRRLLLALLGTFASAALALAAIGLYGVMAYAVTQRTQEIGIRVALGAQRRDVLKLMVGTGMRMALIGVVIGAIGSLGLTRVIQNQLYNVSTTDPITFVGIPLLLLAVALLACWVPARRAAKIQPILALRYE